MTNLNTDKFCLPGLVSRRFRAHNKRLPTVRKLKVERLYDGRDAKAPATALADDVFVGTRLSLNDVNDTMLLVGAIIDRDDHDMFSFVEGQRRLWERWRLELELRLLSKAEHGPLKGIKNDSFLTVRLARFF